MTRHALLMAALLAATATFAGPKQLAAAEDALGTAEFEKALNILDRELKRTRKPPELVARIHMLRAEALHALDRRDDARIALRSALELTPEPPVDTDRSPPTFVALLDDVRSQVLGVLEVTADRDGALVKIDGNPFGPAPLRTRVPVGRHEVQVRTSEASATQSVVVSASEPVSIALTLVDLPGAREGAVETAGPAPTTSSGAAGPTVQREARGSGSSGAVRWLPGAAGVVLGGAGAYFLVQANNNYKALETSTQLPNEDALAHRENGKRNQVIGGAGVVLGLAGIATTAVLLAVGGGQETGAKVSVVPGSNGLHIGLSGEWE